MAAMLCRSPAGRESIDEDHWQWFGDLPHYIRSPFSV
jgi:hypothetical protein